MFAVPSVEPAKLTALRDLVRTTYPGGIHVAEHLEDGPYWIVTPPVDAEGYGEEYPPLLVAVFAAWPGVTVPVAGSPRLTTRVTVLPHFAGQLLRAWADKHNWREDLWQPAATPPDAEAWGSAIVRAITSWTFSAALLGEYGDDGPLVRALEHSGVRAVAALLSAFSGSDLVADYSAGETDYDIEARLAGALSALIPRNACAA